MTDQYFTEIVEQTPSLVVPITIHADPVPLTYEERRAIYAEIRKYDDFMMLPVPEDFWDEDVVSERGLTALHMDAHRVCLMNQGLLELSKEKEAVLRTRLTRKIAILREMRGLPPRETDAESATVGDGLLTDGSGELREFVTLKGINETDSCR
jgi:hypothetical protein